MKSWRARRSKTSLTLFYVAAIVEQLGNVHGVAAAAAIPANGFVVMLVEAPPNVGHTTFVVGVVTI